MKVLEQLWIKPGINTVQALEDMGNVRIASAGLAAQNMTKEARRQ
jgi:hypothetical protein